MIIITQNKFSWAWNYLTLSLCQLNHNNDLRYEYLFRYVDTICILIWNQFGLFTYSLCLVSLIKNGKKIIKFTYFTKRFILFSWQNTFPKQHIGLPRQVNGIPNGDYIPKKEVPNRFPKKSKKPRDFPMSIISSLYIHYLRC